MIDQREWVRQIGQKPINPIGSCFESALYQLLKDPGAQPGDQLCHAIITANAPGQEGMAIGHAWLEFDAEDNGIRLAWCPIWGTVSPAPEARAAMKAAHVREYSAGLVLILIQTTHRLGPWDPKIYEVVEKSSQSS